MRQTLWSAVREVMDTSARDEMSAIIDSFSRGGSYCGESSVEERGDDN